MASESKEHEKRALEALAAGNKIEAIKVLREATGMGLAEAKSAVDRLTAGERLPARSSAPPADLPLEVVDLARRGKTIEAIKTLRERTNVSLEEAKRRVEGVPLDPGVKRAGCAGLVLLACGLASALLVA